MAIQQDPASSVANQGFSEAERLLLDKCTDDEVVTWPGGDLDPAGGSGWAAERTIQATLLAQLVTGERSPEGGQLRILQLGGFRIAGPLDLTARKLVYPLHMENCYFDEEIIFLDAEARKISLVGCVIPSLNAYGLQTVGDFLLTGKFTAQAEISLAGAHIGGNLVLQEVTLNNKGTALEATRLTVDGDMSCEDLNAGGEVSLVGVHIGGMLTLNKVQLGNQNGEALNAVRLTVGADMVCTDFKASGEVSLTLAHIGGGLALNKADLLNKNGTALSAGRLTVDGDMTCKNLTATGAVSLFGARIGGGLTMSTTALDNNSGTALNASGLTVGWDVSCEELTTHGEVDMFGANIGKNLHFNNAQLVNDKGTALSGLDLTIGQNMLCTGFTSCGRIDLAGARIGGRFGLSNAALDNNSGAALDAPGLTVGGDVICTELTTHGEVELFGANIGKSLRFNNAQLANDKGTALSGRELTIGQNMLCTGFTADGRIDLAGARISGRLSLTDATLKNPPDVALTARGASMARLAMPTARPDGSVDLTNATVETLDDHKDAWPDVLHLRGFAYSNLENREVNAHGRLQWLRRDPERFNPQLYDQLAEVYRQAGDEGSARKVLVAKQWRRRRPYNPLSWLWYVTVGYGYRTWQALLWVAILTITGSLVFSAAYPAHMAAQTSHPQRFQPVVYTLDVLLPVIGLGQTSSWQPTDSAVLAWYWVLTGAGWVLSAAVVAGLAGILKRD